MKRWLAALLVVIALPAVIYGGSIVVSLLPPFNPATDVGKIPVIQSNGTVAWSTATAASGTVSGPAASTNNNLVAFSGTGGHTLIDSGVPSANVVLVSRNVTAGTGLTGGGALSSDITLGFLESYAAYTATGSTQATATQITTQVANITAGDGNGVRLPTGGANAATGFVIEVLCSTSANPGAAIQHGCSIWPAAGDTISPLAANARDILPSQTGSRYRYKGGGLWASEIFPMKVDASYATHGNMNVYGTVELLFSTNVSGTMNLQSSGIITNTVASSHRFLDNTTNSWCYQESTNPYLCFSSNNGAERVIHAVPLIGATGLLAAAGTNQSTAAVLSKTAVWTRVTGNNAVTGVALPSGSVAWAIRVMAQSATSTNTLNVYPNVDENDTINGGAADAVYVQAPGSSIVYQTDNGTDWFTY